MVPQEATVEEAYEWKSLKSLSLLPRQNNAVEVGCRGFVAKTTNWLLKRMGVKGQALRQVLKSLSEAADRSSNWLCIERKDSNWAMR